jgi:hypothetical protein
MQQHNHFAFAGSDPAGLLRGLGRQSPHHRHQKEHAQNPQ